MTEPDALPEQDATDVSDHDVDAERHRRSTLQLTAGVLVFLAASLAALAAAGSLGVTGVLIAALIEAAAISWIYRWCEA